jgi:hypothetical protein
MERIEYLKAYAGEGIPDTIAGEYSDGLGGSLVITAHEEDTYHFSLSVVRGPTAHLGEVEGDIQLTAGGEVVFVDRDCERGAAPCCRLSFTLTPRRVVLAEENCEYLHGLRAHFHGRYIKIR